MPCDLNLRVIAQGSEDHHDGDQDFVGETAPWVTVPPLSFLLAVSSLHVCCTAEFTAFKDGLVEMLRYFDQYTVQDA